MLYLILFIYFPQQISLGWVEVREELDQFRDSIKQYLDNKLQAATQRITESHN